MSFGHRGRNFIALNPDDKRERFEALHRIGCVCCLINKYTRAFDMTGLPGEVHHQNEDGKPGNPAIGDASTVLLCTWHHRGYGIPDVDKGTGITKEDMARIYGPSWAQGTRRFREEYPDDQELLDMVNRLIARGIEYDHAA